MFTRRKDGFMYRSALRTLNTGNFINSSFSGYSTNIVSEFLLFSSCNPEILVHRSDVLQILHSAHQGISAMESRARSIVFWPGMTCDIQSTRDTCQACNKNAPSQAAMPPAEQSIPSTPFEAIFADFFSYGGNHYLVAGDRLSSWVEIFKAPHGTAQAGAEGLITVLRSLFATFGVAEELSSDGGLEFTATKTTDFLSKWGVGHRVSSAHFPKSNGRAEIAVKKCKRLLMDNVSPTGSVNNDGLLRALLQMHNTPDPDCNISPAEIIFARPIRDAFLSTESANLIIHKFDQHGV